jgi:hypothetical protein
MIKSSSLIFLVLGFLCLLVVGCAQNDQILNNQDQGTTDQQTQPNQAEEGSAGQNSTSAEEEPSVEEIERAWQNSAHAETFVVDSEGQNNSCARCHAPVAWQPTMDTIPESCFTCKFELEDPPPFISEDQWQDIPCKVCHELDRNDEVQPGYAWLEIAAIDEYAEVDSTTELCQKCHLPADPPEDHLSITVSETHQDQTCTTCHDPHGILADCSTCHSDLDFSNSEIIGHDQDHADIACILCHDGSQLAAGLDEERDQWQLFNPELNDGLWVTSSHNIILEANCVRCHYENNSWGLSVQP